MRRIYFQQVLYHPIVLIIIRKLEEKLQSIYLHNSFKKLMILLIYLMEIQGQMEK